MTYTVQQLKEMPGEDFERASTDTMRETRDWNGAWQHPEVIHRTAAALVAVLGLTDARIQRRAADPECSAEDLARTRQFRTHLASVLESTDRRIAYLDERRSHLAKEWKRVANELADALESSEMDHELDEIQTPFKMTAREWLVRRRAKKPSRVPVWVDEVVEAAA